MSHLTLPFCTPRRLWKLLIMTMHQRVVGIHLAVVRVLPVDFWNKIFQCCGYTSAFSYTLVEPQMEALFCWTHGVYIIQWWQYTVCKFIILGIWCYGFSLHVPGSIMVVQPDNIVLLWCCMLGHTIGFQRSSENVWECDKNYLETGSTEEVWKETLVNTINSEIHEIHE